MAYKTVLVNEFTNGILGPDVEMLGPVEDGGTIVANTAPGCWGPMITPAIRGGHEVTKPVYVEGAEVGDAIAIEIIDVNVTSLLTSSGTDAGNEGCYIADGFANAKCPNCGEMWPETYLDGIGKNAVKCKKCGASCSPFYISNGYTMAFDSQHQVCVTIDKEAAEKAAVNAIDYMKTPDNSIQNPIVSFAVADLPGIPSRMRPFMGQLGTTPSMNYPDSHNAGDFGMFLVGAPHDLSKTIDELSTRTDGHLDINRVRAGAILICPVKVPGGGVYMGDMHAMQGDGEIAGHTCDVAGTVTLKVNVLKGLNIEGPILLPVKEDLPHLAKPLSPVELKEAENLARTYGLKSIERSAPVSFIGSGANLNDAIDSAMVRASALLEIPVEEVKNRLTITGGLEIGRAPGTATATFLVPIDLLKKVGLWEIVQKQYDLYYTEPYSV